jgi:hypothetical protein
MQSGEDLIVSSSMDHSIFFLMFMYHGVYVSPTWVKGVTPDSEHSEHTQIPGGTLVNGGVRQYM